MRDNPASGNEGGLAPTKFQAYLDQHPDTRYVLIQRLHTFPAYQVWLQQFNPNLLRALIDARSEQEILSDSA